MNCVAPQSRITLFLGRSQQFLATVAGYVSIQHSPPHVGIIRSAINFAESSRILWRLLRTEEFDCFPLQSGIRLSACNLNQNLARLLGVALGQHKQSLR